MLLKALVGLFLAIPLLASAVFIPSAVPTVELSMYPDSPAPGDTITIRVENGSPSDTFTWRVNGSVVDQGIGVRAITVTAGRLGSETTVSVSVFENLTFKGEKTVSIRPASVDVLWEGNTYTPPFFGVRPLVNPSSTVKLMAVPHLVQNGVRVGASDVVYTWYMNGSQTPLARGYGKNVITVKPPQFVNAFSLSVVAETRDGLTRAEKAVGIQPVSPDVVIYERAPLLGIRFEQAVEEQFALADEETTFVAYPLYVGSVEAPEYVWSLNGEGVEGKNPREITFRKDGEGQGTYEVEFSLENARAMFERASKDFVIEF